MEPPAAETLAGRSIRTNHVDPGFFDAFGVPVLAGRVFRSSDLGAAALCNDLVENLTGGRGWSPCAPPRRS